MEAGKGDWVREGSGEGEWGQVVGHRVGVWSRKNARTQSRL